MEQPTDNYLFFSPQNEGSLVSLSCTDIHVLSFTILAPRPSTLHAWFQLSCSIWRACPNTASTLTRRPFVRLSGQLCPGHIENPLSLGLLVRLPTTNARNTTLQVDPPKATQTQPC